MRNNKRQAAISPPEVINALANELVDPVPVLRNDQILHLLQLPLQLFDACIPGSRCDTTLQDLLHSGLDVIQIPSNLAHGVIPELEARVTLDAFWEDAGETTSALVALQSSGSFPAFTRTR